MSMFTKTLFAAAAATLAAATISFPALGAEPGTVSVEVRVDDLNLSSSGGQAQLDRRIATAIKQICGRDTTDLAERQVRKTCRAQARSSALAAVKAKSDPTLATR